MKILFGKPVAEKIYEKCIASLSALQARPGLAIIRIGNDLASEIYVAHKKKAAEKLGFFFKEYVFEEKCQSQDVFDLIFALNKDSLVHGIILQLPFPQSHQRFQYLEAVSPLKDVDGLTRSSLFTPCTPLGCFALLCYYRIPIKGKHAVVVGRSRLVGKPLAMLLLAQDATVTITHRQTQNVSFFTKQADILCVCAGQKHFINQEDVSSACVILDIGIHKDTNNTVTGDVCPNVCVFAKTPVPFGIGPLTVACLMWNTLKSAFFHASSKADFSDESLMSFLSTCTHT